MKRAEDCEEELRLWLAPFLAKLGHKARRRMLPVYLFGLIGPGDRKSVQPTAARLAPGDYGWGGAAIRLGARQDR